MYRPSYKRRKPRGLDYGAAWISYSDMMASLLVIFVMVLIYSIYQYFVVVEVKTAEIAEKEAQLSVQQATLDEQSAQLLAQLAKISEQDSTLSSQQNTLALQNDEILQKAAALAEAQAKLDAQQALLDEQQARLNTQQSQLDTQKSQLDAQQAILASTASELESKTNLLTEAESKLAIAQADLAQREKDLNSTLAKVKKQEDMLNNQQLRIDELVGVKTDIIKDLSLALSQNNLKASVDSSTGDIVLESAIFFDTGKYGIKPAGLELLKKFLPVYFSVLMQEKYKDFLGEIIIEGHTDTKGGYLSNLELSQQRALSVVKAALQNSGLAAEQQEFIRSIITAKGKSFSNPIRNTDGSVNMDASRRVEFKFRLKDSEMISEINEILSNMGGGN